MKLHSITGTLGALACLVGAASLHGNLLLFINPPSMVIVFAGTFLMMTATYGGRMRLFWAGLGSWMGGSSFDERAPSDSMRAAEMARGLGQYAVICGLAGMFIGLVMMLQNMSDPGAIGPALAVAMLTPSYGLGIMLLVAAPMCHHHLHKAGIDPKDFPIAGNGFQLIGIVVAGTGISFFVMLLAFANFNF
jgi:flagellar motor component MotA